MSRRLARIARKASASRHLPPDERKDIAEELLGHLLDSAREFRSLGYSARQAERLASRDFGDRRKSRIDLGRVRRGRRVVLFPEAAGEHLAAFRIYDLKGILVIFLLVFLLRWQVVAAYHIPTKSMEPTLHGDKPGGDKILVNKLYYRFSAPERWQIAVFDREGYPQDFIKRIAGLSGELVDIRYGDLYINEEIARKPRDVQDGLLVPVFMDGRDLMAEIQGETRTGLAAFTASGDWSEKDGVFRCTAPPEGLAEICYERPIVDKYLGVRPRADERVVGDLALTFVVRAGEQTLVGAELQEGNDRFEIRIPVGDEGETVLLRNGSEVARVDGLCLSAEVDCRVRFANLDDRVTLEVDGEEVIAYDVEDPSEASLGAGRTVRAAGLGIRGGEATFREVLLQRDIYYRVDGKLPFRVPEGHCFMLGDNSSDSSDSRMWGAVPEDHLIGRPFLVFWPLSRMKTVR